MIMLGCAMSIFARSTCAPSANSPACMRAQQIEVLRRPYVSRYGDSRARHRHACRAPRGSAPRSASRRTPFLSRPAVRRTRTAARSSRWRSTRDRPNRSRARHVVLDRVDVLDVFGERVGVVEPQVARASELARDAEVEADRLCVADVQKTVGLGRKARHHRAAEFARGDVARDHLADKVVVSRRVVSHGAIHFMGES